MIKKIITVLSKELLLTLRRYILLGALLSLSIISAYSQNALLNKAEALYQKNQFEKALPLYEQAIKKDSRNSILNHRLGVCYYETRTNLPKAKKHLLYSASKGIRLSNNYLGKICFLTYEFEQGATYLTKYKNTLRSTDNKIPTLQREILQCKKGMLWLEKIEDVTILEEFDVDSAEFFKAIPLGKESGHYDYPKTIIPSLSTNALLGFITERKDQFIFPYKEDKSDDLYETVKLLDEWSTPKKLTDNINTDSSEIMPFLSTDGITMYFASKGHDGLGDYDLYVTRFNTNLKEFLPPQNLGFPFNSPFDDLLYAVDAFTNTGWFATNRKAEKNKITIYKFTPNKFKKIVDSTDKEELRKRASLLFFQNSEIDTMGIDSLRIEPLPKDSVNSVKMEQNEDNDRVMRFVINDTIIYTSLQQFNNMAAKEAWHKYDDASTKNRALKLEIDSLRTLFTNAENGSSRNSLAAKVIGLENDVYRTNDAIKEWQLTTRRLELETIQQLKREGKSVSKAPIRPTGTEIEALHPNKIDVPSWKETPLTIATPDTIYPEFQTKELQQNFTSIFNKAELEDLSESEAKNLAANNLIMTMEELILEANQPGDPQKDNRPLWEKIIRQDTTFAQRLSRQELMAKARISQSEGLRKFIEVNNHRYEVLKFKANALGYDSKSQEAKQRITTILNEAQFYATDASKYVQPHYVDESYGLQQLGLSANLLKKACAKAETAVIIGWNANNNKSATTETPTVAIKELITKPTKPEQKVETPKIEEPKDEISYLLRVQIGIFSQKLSEEKTAEIQPIFILPIPEKNIYKYYSGNFKTKEEAEAGARRLSNLGYKGAFIVPFKNNTPISWQIYNIQKK